MKKRTKYIGIVAAVLIAAAVCGGIYAWKIHKKNTMVSQQNYVASKMLEIGQYEQGRILSAQTEQMEANIISERLLVLAAGFQTDYEVGIIYADMYLEAGEDEIISSARAVYQKTLDAMEEALDWSAELYLTQAEAVRQELLPFLLRVQNSISVKKGDNNMIAIVDLMSGGGNASSVAMLEKDDSLISQKAQISYAIRTRDYRTAYEKAEALYLENGTFENRAALANLAAGQWNYLIEDEQLSELRNQQAELWGQMRELEDEYARETSSSKKSRIIKKIEKLQSKIEELQQDIDAAPALKAINFMEAKSPASERNTDAYKIEMAQLHYQAGQSDKARELLVDVITADRRNAEPVGLMFSDLLRAYTDKGNRASFLSYGYEESDSIRVLWNRIAQLLGFVEGYNQYGEKNFYSFVLNILEELYNGLIIRNIDATDYPTVRMTVNVSMELEHTLTKQDFLLVEMGEELEDFALLNVEELQDAQGMSVVLVVDRSGSMDGTPMEDTKQAVTNFVKTVDGTISLGLVAFDSDAQLVEAITNNKSSILRGIAALQADGGTDIYSGLKLAGQALEAQAGRRVIILLSDGEDGNPEMIDEVLDDLVRKEIYVYTIGFGGVDTEYLSYIARKCNGKFIQADSSSMLGEIYSSVGKYMVNDYVIEFNIVTEPDKFTRTIKVLMDVNDAFAEQEYYIGVPYDAIKAEQYKTPLADYFRQIGGSLMETD